MLSKLFKTKSITSVVSDAEGCGRGLKKSLSAPNLVSLGIGAIVGTGIFVLTGTTAANYSGPALTLSFMLSALGCVMAALCYAEFSAMIPVSGSAYSYSYATLGEFPAWMQGWILVIQYLVASAAVAVGWSAYVVSFLGEFFTIPKALAIAPFEYVTGEGWVATGGLVNLPALFIIFTLMVMLTLGIKQSARLNNIIVAIKMTVILLFIGFGAWYINTDNWVPYIPENTGIFGQFGWSGIVSGAGVIFFAFIGFDCVSTAAQEAKNPQRDLPIGILGSLVICTVLYVAVTAVLTGIVNYKELNVAAPIALAIDRTDLDWLQPLIKIGAIAGLSTVSLVLLLSMSRIFFNMSKDGLLPRFFGKVSAKHHTPVNSIYVTGILSTLIAGFVPIKVLGELVSLAALLSFCVVCASILILRKRNPTAHRPFRTPWVPFVPIMGIVICGIQMFALPFDTWIRLLVWLGIGLLVYFLYGIKHSNINNN